MNYEKEDTISLSDGCRLLNANLPRLKRLSGKGNFQIIEVEEYKHRRIITDGFLDYAEKLLEQKGKERQHLKDSINELKLSLGMSVTDVEELENNQEMFQEFVTYLNYLGQKTNRIGGA